MMFPREDDTWFDDAAGPIARPYTITGGRTHAGDIDLQLLSLVVALPGLAEAATMAPEYARIVRLCQRPLSVAEVAAHLDLPVPIVKVLLADLVERGHVIYRTSQPINDTPDQHVLQAVLDGIRRL
ncbi:DUF742 domain-containing protein [Amycolatopsis endophytica]|uniref:DUF742 domain-containing protein n=2 Tax=Amycolatopsis endophytica TaxID=860233 RepID=A0A853B4G5_9PSEU|nr:hypothetical protein [Amycolatopsis endophytica]